MVYVALWLIWCPLQQAGSSLHGNCSSSQDPARPDTGSYSFPTVIFETLNEGAKPGPAGREQSLAVCRWIYENNWREKLEKKRKQKDKFRYGITCLAALHQWLQWDKEAIVDGSKQMSAYFHGHWKPECSPSHHQLTALPSLLSRTNPKEVVLSRWGSVSPR